jgi:hypothetical protein
MNLKNDTAIFHYNKLEGVDRILTELYGVALRASKQDEHDPYSQRLLAAILAVSAAQRQIPWSPSGEPDATK